MEKLKKLFGETNMTWLKVIILALASAIFTAVMMMIPSLKETSFQDIGVNLDAWFLFAIFIIMNCKKWWEASLKTFVFFLISQPLIYLIQILCKTAEWDLIYYYKNWIVITLLTLPGAAIAYLIKKNNILSVLILSVATGYLGYAFVPYINSVISDFPHHLLSAIFCISTIIILILTLIEKKSLKIVAFLLVAIVIAGTFIYTNRAHSYETTLGDGNWSYTVEDDSIISADVDGNKLIIKSKHDGHTYVYANNDLGEKREYYVTITGGNVWVDRIEVEE